MESRLSQIFLTLENIRILKLYQFNVGPTSNQNLSKPCLNRVSSFCFIRLWSSKSGCAALAVKELSKMPFTSLKVYLSFHSSSSAKQKKNIFVGFKSNIFHSILQFMDLCIIRYWFSGGGLGDGKGNCSGICWSKQGTQGGEEGRKESRILALSESTIVLHIS